MVYGFILFEMKYSKCQEFLFGGFEDIMTVKTSAWMFEYVLSSNLLACTYHAIGT